MIACHESRFVRYLPFTLDCYHYLATFLSQHHLSFLLYQLFIVHLALDNIYILVLNHPLFHDIMYYHFQLAMIVTLPIVSLPAHF